MANERFRVLQNLYKLLVDQGDGTHAEKVIAQPPAILLTGDTNPRLRVDVGQTGFFEGREFRTFHEFSIPTGQSAYLRATVPFDIILYSTKLTLDNGQLRLTLRAGGAEAGTWAPVAVLPKNTMAVAPAYAGQVSVDAGGTHSGGVTLDVVRLGSTSLGHRVSTVGGQVADERGVGAGVYYYQLENLDGETATGVFSAFWEERP